MNNANFPAHQLIFACKDEPNKTYQVARDYLEILISGLNESKDFYNQEYRGEYQSRYYPFLWTNFISCLYMYIYK